METIFDHDPTPEELEVVFNVRTEEDLIRYRKTLAAESDTQLGEIARLYLHRGDPQRAARYLAHIRDPGYRLTLQSAYLHPDLIQEIRADSQSDLACPGD
ncbi:hypothetical protein SAMN02746041_02079 [Desulfacinum hydrothermale DSM 13146]|uniref:Tetratricopeptide repeat protein n=1 Tax=Desulfacinum hydrothermale DSM 13146 TaxID=1121390 RepID=A0A1W1XL05_9BACT|nr:hypothetical protein [Desulfacinum hydrothermale]SMC24653.1 hypothetical protein SAMN02746041_02079 [Desulfacinum hydrothermale DSM 13146]